MHKAYVTLFVVPVLFLLSCVGGSGKLDAFVTGRAGNVQVFRDGGDTWVDLDTADVVGWNDSVRVGGKGFLELTFGENNVVRLDENTKVHFTDVTDSTGTRAIEAHNHHGTVLSNIEKLDGQFDRYQVRTPEAIVEAPGTYFSVTYTLHTRSAEVMVVEGEVQVVYPEIAPEPVVVAPGYQVVVPWGRPPRSPARISKLRWRRIERVINPSVRLVRPHGPMRGYCGKPLVKGPARGAAPGGTKAMQKRGPVRPGGVKAVPGGGRRPALKPGPAKKGGGKPAVRKAPVRKKSAVKPGRPGPARPGGPARKAPALKKKPAPGRAGPARGGKKPQKGKGKDETKGVGGKKPKGPGRR